MDWLWDLFWDWDWESALASAISGIFAEALAALYIWLALRYTPWLDGFPFNPWWILLVLAGVFLIFSVISAMWEDGLLIPLVFTFILALPLLIVTAPVWAPIYMIYNRNRKRLQEQQRRRAEKFVASHLDEFRKLLSNPQKSETARDEFVKSLWSELGFISQEKLTQLFSTLITSKQPWGMEQCLKALGWTTSDIELDVSAHGSPIKNVVLSTEILSWDDEVKVRSASKEALIGALSNSQELFAEIKRLLLASGSNREYYRLILKEFPTLEDQDLITDICHAFWLLEVAPELCTLPSIQAISNYYYNAFKDNSEWFDGWMREIFPIWADLTQGYAYAEYLDDSVSSPVSLPSEIERGRAILTIVRRVFDKAASFPYGRERQLTYELFEVVYSVLFRRDLFVLLDQGEELLDLPSDSLLYPKTVDALRNLVEISRLVYRSERSGLLVTDQLAYYASALGILQSSFPAIDEEVAAPDNWFLRHSMDRWSKIIVDEIAKKRAKSDLAIELVQPQLVGPYYQVGLTLKNRAGGLAERVRIRFDPEGQLETAGVRAREPQVEIDFIRGGQTTPVQFKLVVSRPGSFRLPFFIEYDDLERTAKTMQFADEANFVGEEHPFEDLENTYIAGPPLRTGEMFYGRQNIFEYIEKHLPAGKQQNLIVLVGERRTGKTSILYQLKNRLADPFLPVLVDLQGAAGKDEDKFWYYLATSLYEAFTECGISLEKPELTYFRQSDSSVYFRNDFLKKAKNAAPDRVPILLIDEFDVLEKSVKAKDLPPAIFDNLRTIMQHKDGLGFIFAGTYDITKMGADYWSVLFNTALWKRIELLDWQTFKSLVEDPAKGFFKYDELALQRIWNMTSGHPFFTQLLCRELVTYRNENRLVYLTVQDVENVIEDVIDQLQVHLSYMWDGLSNERKQFLVVVSELLEQRGFAVLSEIRKSLTGYNISVNLEETLKELKAKAILTEKEGQFEFPIGLIHKWIYATKNLEELTWEGIDEQ